MTVKAFEYPNPIHPRHAFATGAILADDVTIGRFVQRSKERLADRFDEKGLSQIYSFIMITDDCDPGQFFSREEHRERYLGEAVIYRDLEKLAKLHLGGGPDDAVLAFNRMVAANLTAVLALTERGKKVIYLVPRYERQDVMKGYGHPSIPRAADIAGCPCEIVTTAEEVRTALAKGDVCLLGICAYYRDVLPEVEVEEACKAARARKVPILVDDASGARARVYDYGQRRALDLGADVVCTSTDKYGFHGPRSAFMVGRRELIDRIRAVALMLGTEARPSIAAAICRTIAEYTPENAYQDNRILAELHDELYTKLLPIFGPKLKNKHEHGIRMAPEDFLELVMEKAGVRKVDVAPIDVTSAHATFALKHHGYIMLAGFSYPGGSREIWVHLNHKRARTMNLDELAKNLGETIDATAGIVASKAKVEDVLMR
jgi:L-seryl-tRNA(Ser) seleniumtransferase